MRVSQGFLMLGTVSMDPLSCNWCVSRDYVVVSLQMIEEIDLYIFPHSSIPPAVYRT